MNKIKEKRRSETQRDTLGARGKEKTEYEGGEPNFTERRKNQWKFTWERSAHVGGTGGTPCALHSRLYLDFPRTVGAVEMQLVQRQIRPSPSVREVVLPFLVSCAASIRVNVR